MGKKKTAAKTPRKPRVAAIGPRYAPRVRSAVLAREQADGNIAVMLPEQTGHIFLIDGVAARLWLGFDGETTLLEHEARITEEFAQVPSRKIRRDVRSFVARALKQGLLE